MKHGGRIISPAHYLSIENYTSDFRFFRFSCFVKTTLERFEKMSSKKKVSREDVATYAIQHNIRGTLNEMLNLMLRQMPEDPVRYLADLLESRGR